ncbi:hypothetical protein B0H63DRAFT_225681 [Podospora didyma]|uniref:Uncharacterized protein n=1 Tax=Podospora didyma TaxID=330526 RepID=A0AAE0KKA9_9PEZI|nr:hypothetical protein B0H63DRAFT_225681 [Podospora didyma]
MASSSSATNTSNSLDENRSRENVESYKAKLDKAAAGVKDKVTSHDNEQGGSTASTIVDKVSQYIPAVGRALGHEEPKPALAPQAATSGPPNRPEHDTQIEEFVRDQHRSKDVLSSLDE